jgi:hypothetical protein
VAAALAAAACTQPMPVAAHAIGGTFPLPVPLWLYLAGAAAAVAASFLVLALTRQRIGPRRRGRIPIAVAAGARWLLAALGLVWWYGAIVVGFVVGDISPLPAVLLWVGLWLALPIVASVIGNPWPAMSPFRSTLAILEGLGARAGIGLDAGLRYPSRLARWPAVALLAAAIWSELILPEGAVAVTVASLMTGYTLLTVLGAIAFGRAAWLRNAELFEVLLGWYGRIGPVAGRSVRGWFRALGAVRDAGWSDAAFVMLVLTGVTFDGLRETAFAAAVLTTVLPPVYEAFGPTLVAFLAVDTIALLALYVIFLGLFALAVAAGRLLAGPSSEPMGRAAGTHAAAMLPIAAGYLVAHYLTLVVQGAVWLPSLIADPLMSLAPDVGWIPVAFVWYLSVAAIVGGHVAAVGVAHRLAARRTPRGRRLLAGLPMVVLMIGYTVLSLWIIAQPIVVEPGSGAASAARATGQPHEVAAVR